MSQIIDPNTDKPITSGELDKVKEELRSYEKSTLRWVRATVIVSILSVVGVAAQWNEMRSGGADTKSIAEAAKSQSDQAQLQTKAMTESNSQTAELIRQAIAQASATNALALQAKRSAASAEKSLEEIHANFLRDQRPWVFGSDFNLSTEPEPEKEITISLNKINTGKTPALRTETQFSLLTGPNEPPFTVFSEPSVSNTADRSVINPGTVYATRGFLKLIVPANQIEAYKAKRINMYFHVLIWYGDDFTSLQHWTALCVYRIYGMPLNEWRYCSKGNDVDHEDQKKPN